MNGMEYVPSAQGIQLKRAKSLSSRAFNLNLPQRPSKLALEQQTFLKSPASSMNFFTRETKKASFRQYREENHRKPMHKAQSMRVPPGFDTFDSNSILDLEEDAFESSLLDLEFESKPRERQLKRFVTFANLKLQKKHSFRAHSEFSDDEDVDVDVIEDESLIEMTSDPRRGLAQALFENVDVRSNGSTSTTASNSPHRRRFQQASPQNGFPPQQTHSYSHSQIPVGQSYSGLSQGHRQPQEFHPMGVPQQFPQQHHSMGHMGGMYPSPQDDYLAQNRMLMELVMKQNALLQQQHFGQRFPQQPPMRQSFPEKTGASSLLVKHKTSGYRPTLTELAGSILEFARDSHGSRLIQSLMDTASAQQKERVIDEVMPEAVSLMQDLFGNYVMQNFLEHCTPVQREKLAFEIKNAMNVLSFKPHGCRVVQRAIDVFTPEERNSLLEEVVFPESKILTCARDPHATHVLQKAVVLLQREVRDESVFMATNELNRRILEAIEVAVKQDIKNLAMHPHACRLVQKVLGKCAESKSSHVKEMLETIRTIYPTLSVEQHGNFILQHIIDNGTKEQQDEIQNYVASRFLELSQHKFGSHLVEKCLNSSNKEQAFKLVTELLKPALALRERRGGKLAFNDKDSSDVLLSLMKDPYANFVVQRAYDASEGKLKSSLRREITERSDILSRFTYGRHILSHVNKK